jgi:hypothetical protein
LDQGIIENGIILQKLVLTCDRCLFGKDEFTDHSGYVQQSRDAMEKGWKNSGGLWLCSDCSGKREAKGDGKA